MRWSAARNKGLLAVTALAVAVAGGTGAARLTTRLAGHPASEASRATEGSAPGAQNGTAAGADGSADAAAADAARPAQAGAPSSSRLLRAGRPDGRVVVSVRFRPGTRATAVSGAASVLAAAPGGKALRRSAADSTGTATYAVRPADVAAFVAAMRARGDVLEAGKAEPMSLFFTPNDPQLPTQQSVYLSATNLGSAWEYTHGSAAVKIAVVDTGVDVTHPDLVNKIAGTFNAVDGSTDVTDKVGHGTFVAGVAGAGTNNGKGIAGAGYNSKILAVKVADANGDIFDADLATGIRWAADNGAAIINLSLGRVGSSTVVADAVTYARGKGALVVAAAGNSGQEGNPKIYPAALSGVLSVGATDAQGHRAFFSEHGAWVTMAAPGVAIRGTTPVAGSELWGAVSYSDGGGTSFAAPLVAGAAALLLARAPGTTAAQLRAALVASAHGYTASGFELGAGQLDAGRAIQQQLVPTVKPTLAITSAVDAGTVVNFVSVDSTPAAAGDRVAFFVDGLKLAGPTTSTTDTPFFWDTTGYSQTAHTVETRECAPTGPCQPTGTTVQLTPVEPAPVIETPDGSAVSGSLKVPVAYHSPIGILVDGVLTDVDVVGTGNDSPDHFNPEVDLSALADGSHTVQAVACNWTGTLCEGPRSASTSVTSTSLAVSAGAVTNPVFSPNADTVKETTSLAYTLGSAQTVIASVENRARIAVRTVSLGAQTAGPHTFTWDGKDDAGNILGGAVYTLRILTTDPAQPGVRGFARAKVRLDKTLPKLTDPSPVAAAPTIFYPAADGYKDNYTAKITLSEKSKLTLTVKNAAGTTVRTISATDVTGRQSVVWDGRNGSGALVAAGTYTYVFTATDAGGNKRSTGTFQVFVRTTKLTTLTTTITKSGTSAYAIGNGAACVTETHTGSTYANGLWLKNNCAKTTPAIAAAWYHVTVPGAVSYTSFKVVSNGRSHSQPATVAAGVFSTITDDYDLTWPLKEVTDTATKALTLGTIKGPGHAPKKVVDVVVYVPNDLHGPLTDWDVQNVKLIVIYQALR